MNTGAIWNPVSIWNVMEKILFLFGTIWDLSNITKKFQKDRFDKLPYTFEPNEALSNVEIDLK